MPRIEIKKTNTAIYNGQIVETVDATPTWQGILPVIILALEHGNQEGRAIAMQELQKMAKICDDAVSKQKAEEYTASIVWTVAAVHERNEENNDYDMTDDDAMEILNKAIADHDFEFGVTWLHIDNEIEEWHETMLAIEQKYRDEEGIHTKVN